MTSAHRPAPPRGWRHVRQHLQALACTLALVACGGGEGAQAPREGAALAPVAGPPAAPPAPAASAPPAPRTLADLERSGALPALDRSDSLAGPDTDHNGVRDDIDAYLQRTYPDPLQRAAALQLARGFQAAVALNSPDRESNREVGTKISRGTRCVFLRFVAPGDRNPSVVGRELEAMTTNTRARLKAYLQHNKALDGTTWALPGADACE